jgi:hypothetical protein
LVLSIKHTFTIDKPFSSTTEVRQTSDKTTLMLIAITVKFLLLNAPTIILNIVESLYKDVGELDAFVLASEVSNIMVATNSATNCLVYFRWRSKISGGKNVAPKVRR